MAPTIEELKEYVDENAKTVEEEKVKEAAEKQMRQMFLDLSPLSEMLLKALAEQDPIKQRTVINEISEKSAERAVIFDTWNLSLDEAEVKSKRSSRPKNDHWYTLLCKFNMSREEFRRRCPEAYEKRDSHLVWEYPDGSSISFSADEAGERVVIYLNQRFDKEHPHENIEKAYHFAEKMRKL